MKSDATCVFAGVAGRTFLCSASVGELYTTGSPVQVYTFRYRFSDNHCSQKFPTCHLCHHPYVLNHLQDRLQAGPVTDPAITLFAQFLPFG